MEKNNITRILRAHECPSDRGCAVTDIYGDGSCLIVFSAPYYFPASRDDFGSRNQGGYLLISNPNREGNPELELTHVVTGRGKCNDSSSTSGIKRFILEEKI